MNNSVVEASVQRLYELILICRPTNPIQFTTEYFEDEKKSDPEYYHAMRTLVHLARDDEKHFRDSSSTIFNHLLEKSRGKGMTGASMVLGRDMVRHAVALLFDESYIPPVPQVLRERVEETLIATTFGFLEFDLYMRLVVRTSVLLHFMKDVISVACALKMVEGSKAVSCDCIEPQELLACLSHPKMKVVVANIPNFVDDQRPGDNADSSIVQSLVTVLNSMEEERYRSSGVTAVDIVLELLGGSISRC